MSCKEKEFIPLNVVILTVSDTRTADNDTSGDYLEESVKEAGHICMGRKIVHDCIYQIRDKVSHWIASPKVQVVLITGGTGFYDRDITPEAIRPLFDKEVDGFGEMFRAVSLDEIGMSTMQSRAVAGLANRTLIFALPGSTNACRTAWTKILQEQLDCRTRPCNFYPHIAITEAV